ncbi:hypothetical protein [Actinomyces gaoshouyii]|uniref:hypothetical protein n=1 Tax=Actinomyces gaoshouyii TaxID=1960083 RepID=UPI0009C016CF|nr:hypothetical protein [Actinomyces gaoshouyii]ARD42523.1 hypothetical protein B6G06_09350 [Actinomyces gaoshouyii]
MGGDLNLKGGWNTILSAIEAATGSKALFTVLSVAGTVIVITAVMATLIAKRRGGQVFGGHDNSKITGAVIAGALLVAPKVVIPAALWVIDLVGNAVIQVLRNSGVGI